MQSSCQSAGFLHGSVFPLTEQTTDQGFAFSTPFKMIYGNIFPKLDSLYLEQAKLSTIYLNSLPFFCLAFDQAVSPDVQTHLHQ